MDQFEEQHQEYREFVESHNGVADSFDIWFARLWRDY